MYKFTPNGGRLQPRHTNICQISLLWIQFAPSTPVGTQTATSRTPLWQRTTSSIDGLIKAVRTSTWPWIYLYQKNLPRKSAKSDKNGISTKTICTVKEKQYSLYFHLIEENSI